MPIEIPDKKPEPAQINFEYDNPPPSNPPKQTHSHDEPKEDPHKLLGEMLPKGVNFGKCANGNCGTKIKNAKGITTKFKTCPNCRFNGVPKSSSFCPTCGKDSEEFDDSDIDLETDEED